MNYIHQRSFPPIFLMKVIVRRLAVLFTRTLFVYDNKAPYIYRALPIKMFLKTNVF